MKAYNSDITVEEFIAQHATPYDEATDNYFREPFAKDTKVGKNSAIYNAHSYHTKVPPEGVVLQELMERKLSNRGVTMPYIDTLCRSAFKKVEGKWYLPSEEIRSERLNLEVEDEPSAIEWIRQQLTTRSMSLPELIPPWRQATLKVGNRLEKTLPQLLEENFWRDVDTGRWRLPTEAERQHMGDERTLRIRRNIQRLREGKLDSTPKDGELLEWMLFAYQHLTDHRAVVEIYQRLNPTALSEADRKKAKRLYEFCVTQAPETADEGQSPQLRLFR